MNGMELAIWMTDDNGIERLFMDRKHAAKEVKVIDDDKELKVDFYLQDIAAHFEIPDVPDIAACHPEQQKLLDARLILLQERSIPSHLSPSKLSSAGTTFVPPWSRGWSWLHDTGLGKSIAGLALPCLWGDFVLNEAGGLHPAVPTLLIAPEHLHEQWANEAWDRFHIRFTKLDCQDTYLRLSSAGTKPLAPGYYITSFTQLATNKVDRFPSPESMLTMDANELKKLCDKYGVDAKRAAVTPLPFALNRRDSRIGDDEEEDLEHGPMARVRAALTARFDKLLEGVGIQDKNGIRCVYSASLADLCRKAFDVVVIDEATKIKGDQTLVGLGCRLMDPKYRLVLTATPIKNRLPDVFWLIWWATGGKAEAHPRWPYSSEDGQQETFSAEFPGLRAQPVEGAP
jgi:hypothetical protein